VSETIGLDLIGAILRTMQAEQRTLRTENELIRKEMGRMMGLMATRQEVSDVLRVITDRIGNFEALMETRFDQLSRASVPAAQRPETGRGSHHAG
jgi:hypothetical protein